MKRRAFTFVELIVVIAILAVLVAMLLPAMQQAKEQTYRMVCASQLRQVGVATMVYTNDFKGAFPVTAAHTQITTSGTTQEVIDRDINSMNAFFGYMNKRYDAYFCPTSWAANAAVNPPYTLRSWYRSFKGPISSSINGSAMVGAYLKLAGTRRTWQITPSRQSNITRGSFYDEIQLWNSNVSLNYRPGGYFSLKETDFAKRTGGGTQPPDKICLFSDFTRYRTLVGIYRFEGASHIGGSYPGTPADPAFLPRTLCQGINEVLADGHVVWTNLGSQTVWYLDAPTGPNDILLVANDR